MEDLQAIRCLKRGHWDGLETLMRRGSAPRAVDTGPAQVVAPVGWLADNQTLLYAASMDGGKFGFKSHNLGTGEMKDLFTIQNKSGFGALSADGGWLVYASREFSTEGYDIFISRIDGSERRRIAGADTPATTAVWSPDGGWLVLNTHAGDGQQIPVLVNPFTCQALRLNTIHGSVEDWSPCARRQHSHSMQHTGPHRPPDTLSEAILWTPKSERWN